MRKHRETEGPLSRLPQDDAYWEALTDRLVTHAAGRLSAYRGPGSRWRHGLARFSTPLTVGAAAAVIAALLSLPEAAREATPGSSPATLYGFAADDPLAAVLVASAAAPTMATLLTMFTSERAP